MIPTVLKSVEEYLRDIEIHLIRGSHDARADSASAEEYVVSLIQNANRWKVFSPNLGRADNRGWYDVRIRNYYINIKISTCTTTDNTNAKKAIFWLLTGIKPDDVPTGNKQFFKLMRENESEDQRRDYFYLVINKTDPSDVFFVSLKGLAHCQLSPNNLPFQSNWDKCRKPVKRDWHEAKSFLLGKWAQSIQRAIELQQNGMPNVYPEYFQKTTRIE
ncbi:MAG: hypothetical protein OXO49_09355 [Gammaproteobacteria bacterium]|nr:hypothetical protein [Gammaproteobacteria bacterium]MDE0252788.1 hypothetical protein [Gammaproteobacteria bacterium]MDE0402203.1 hypothetical protein [Gammaproteobacteria bacterium]